MTSENAKAGTIKRPRQLPEGLESLRRWLLRRVWYVHPGLTLTVNISPVTCLRILGTISRPDAARLEYRHLFTSGRRYHLHTTPTGFAVTTTTKVVWKYRGRTASNAVLFGDFEEVDRTTTRIRLSGRIKMAHLLSAFLIPAFISSMILGMPWHGLILMVLVALLFGLSWAGHRLNAALEVYEMIHFVRKALEAYIPEPLAAVGAGGVITGTSRERDFVDAWEKFYEAHRHDVPDS